MEQPREQIIKEEIESTLTGTYAYNVENERVIDELYWIFEKFENEIDRSKSLPFDKP